LFVFAIELNVADVGASALHNMDTDKIDSTERYSDELESIRDQIARLQSLISKQQEPDNRAMEIEGGRVLESDKRILERLIDSSVDGILAFDCDLVFTVWNPGMECIFGIRAKDVLGKHVLDACPFFRELGEVANFEAALSGQRAISRDNRFPISGTTRQGWFEGYYGPILGSPNGGDVIGGLAIIRDVTERKLAEERQRISEERYRELFENACDMVYTHDLAGNITAINRAAERIIGYSRVEALQMKFNQLVAPEFQNVVHRMIDRQLVEGAPIMQEIEIVAKDANRFVLEVSHRLIFQEGRAVGVQGIGRDVTERKKAEQALHKANQELEARVRDLQQRTHEMTLLSELGDILRACLSTDEIYDVIKRVAREIFPAQSGALYVIGPQRTIVEAVAEWGDTTKFELTFAPDECWGLRRGRIHWVRDSSGGLICKHLYSPPPKGSLCVPMMAQSEALGILHLAQNNDEPLPEAKGELAMAMAEHVGMAISNLRLHETLRNQSIRDPLTGLFNRSFMEESLELELRRAIRAQYPLSIIMLSLDHFQQLNDNFGVDAGDAILKDTSALLQTNVRKGDIACRYGNHSFVLIMPQSSFDTSVQRAESMRALARNLDLKYHNGISPITASIGLAAFPGHGQTVEMLLRSAEAALKRAVSAGDCVVAAN
jgi:diguanylate cyclase (GGDEF)-like protein/PAS domain S-box-containing protein